MRWIATTNLAWIDPVMAATRTGGVNMVYQTGGLHSGSPSFSLWKNKTHNYQTSSGKQTWQWKIPTWISPVLKLHTLHGLSTYVQNLRNDPETKSFSFPIQAIDHLDPSRTLKVTRSEPLDSHDMGGAAGGARWVFCSLCSTDLFTDGCKTGTVDALQTGTFHQARCCLRTDLKGKGIQQFRARLAASGVLCRTVSKVNDGAPVVEPLHPTEWCCAGSFPNTTILPIRGRAWKYDWDDWPTIRY